MKFKDYIQGYIDKSDLDTNSEKWIKFMTKTCLILSLAGAALGWAWTKSISGIFIGAFATGIGMFFFFIFNLTYRSYKKAKDVEDVLPDALELISSGIKAGLPVRNAIESVTRPEFSPLSNELSRAFVEESTGISFEESLERTSLRISSPLYAKSMGTLIKSIQSGVNVDKIAESLSKNINEVKNIRKDIRASTVTYTLFLSFAALFASPVLFSLSSFLVTSNVFLTSQSAGSDSSGIPGSFLQVFTALPPVDTLNNFFLVAITIVSISTSVAIGIVSKGSYKEGIKVAPFFVIFALLMFYLSKSFVTNLFGV